MPYSTLKASVQARREALETRYQQWPRHTLAEHFQCACKQWPNDTFLYIDDRKLSYHALWQRTETMAKALLNQGIKRRDHVALLINNHEDYVPLMLACAMIGAVAIPVNAMLSKKELAYILAQSDTQCLIVQPQVKDKQHLQAITELVQQDKFKAESQLQSVIVFHGTTDAPCPPILSWKAFIDGGQGISDTVLKARFAASHYPDEVAIILYTSGSTGLPKGVMLTHDMLLRCAYSTCLSRAIEVGRITLAPLPFYHCFAIIEAILAMSFVGGSLISALGASPLKTLQLLEQHKANDYLCVPSMLVPLVNHPKIKDFDLSCLFATWCGAAPAPVPTWEKAITLLGLTEIITGYGQTEVSSSGVTTEVGDSLDIITARVGRPKLGGISGLEEFAGSPVQYKTIDRDSGQTLPKGAIGELVVRGNTVTRGYYKKPDETAATIDKDGWLRTGDVGRIDEAGYLQVLGRSKEMYKVSGELVAPREVENVLYDHPAIKQVQVVGVPDSRTTEIGAAFIELKQGQHFDRTDMRRWCHERLAKFKIPRHMWQLEAHDWPMTSTGKIQKFRLTDMAKNRLKSSQNPSPVEAD